MNDGMLSSAVDLVLRTYKGISRPSQHDHFSENMYPDWTSREVELEEMAAIAKGEFKDSKYLRRLGPALADIVQMAGMKTAKLKIALIVRHWMAEVKVGSIAIRGAEGSGKTLLCRYLANLLAAMFPSKKIKHVSIRATMGLSAEMLHSEVLGSDILFIDNVCPEDTGVNAIKQYLNSNSVLVVLSGTRDMMDTFNPHRFDTWIDIDPYSREDYSRVVSTIVGAKVEQNLLPNTFPMACRSAVSFAKKILAFNAGAHIGRARGAVTVQDVIQAREDKHQSHDWQYLEMFA
jgi:hypothetical protein